MKKIFVVLMVLPFALFSQEADTTYWKMGGAGSITFTQVSLTNWAAGGDNSVSLNGYFNVFADYTKDKIVWSNNLEMGYGIIKQGDADSRKTDDILAASTQIGYKISKTVFWSSLLDFRTQFVEGLDGDGNRISDFMAPGYLLVATGLDWQPSPIFSLTYAPLTGKFTFVSDQVLANSGAFGVDAGEIDPNNPLVFLTDGKTTRAELGSFLKAKLVKENVIKNVNFTSKLELFTNYLQDFPTVDVNWQNAIVMKVNDFLSVNWQTQLIFDEDIQFVEVNATGDVISSESRVQFKSVFGVGISYKFGQSK